MGTRKFIAAFGVLVMTVSLVSCAGSLYQPERATRPYPADLHTTQTVDMQMFRDNEKLEIVNTTATTYSNVDIWINQRYVRHLDVLPAGESVTMSLWDFVDQWGGIINAGGVFRTYEPTPVRLVEIQINDTDSLVGLITIRSEEAPDVPVAP